MKAAYPWSAVLLLAACPHLRADDVTGGAVAQRMRHYIEQKQITGAVTLMGHKGKIVHHAAVGKADLAASRDMHNDSLFWIASMTKPITAAALMILVDEGKAKLDDSVAKHIPAFADVKLNGGSAPKTTLTIRHLMTHTSGVQNAPRQEDLSLKNVADEMAKRPLQFEPGSQWRYSNGLHIIARIIEVQSGMSYEDFLQQRIFDPLGMTDTTFWPDEKQRARLATIYKPGKNDSGFEPADAWFASFDPANRRPPNPSGGLVSKATDMFRFYQMVLSGGELDGKRIVSTGGVKEMTRLQTPDLTTGFTPGNGWGLGWCLVRQPQGVSAMLHDGTFGHGGAFGTQGWVDPKSETIYVLMIARTGFGNSDASEIRKDFQRLAVEALR